MRECDDESRSGGLAQFGARAANANPVSSSTPIRFTRQELHQILNLYGRKVAAGEWRDYAIDQLSERAVFSIFRRSSEMPLYRIVKQPRLARRQGAYSVVTPTGVILRRGHEIRQVLRAIDSPLRVVA
jgi:hypothetical protein